jgi:hypothetical protein
MIKFYLKDGREHFKIQTPYADVDTIADEAHKKSYPIEYSKFIKSLEPVKEIVKEIVEDSIDLGVVLFGEDVVDEVLEEVKTDSEDVEDTEPTKESKKKGRK